MPKPRILCDMDGVFVNFDDMACKAHGVSVEEMTRHREPGEWSIVRPLGIARNERLGIDGPSEFTENDFWKPITALKERFWLSLAPMPWHRELLHLLDSVSDDWHIVTAPSRCPSSFTGKVKWLQRYFGVSFNRFALTPHKYTFATPGAILIDDRASNVKDFIINPVTKQPTLAEAHLFPHYGNTNYSYSADPVGWLERRLRQYLKGPLCTSSLETSTKLS